MALALFPNYSPTVLSAASLMSSPRYMPASCSSRSSNTRAEGMSRLRLASKYDAHRADNGNAFLDGKPAALALINKQTVGMEFLRQLDCLGLAGIHDPGVLPGLGQILYRFDAQPRRKRKWLRSNSSSTASGMATSLKSLVRMSAAPTLSSPVSGEVSKTTIIGFPAIQPYAGLPTAPRRRSEWEFCACPIRRETRLETDQPLPPPALRWPRPKGTSRWQDEAPSIAARGAPRRFRARLNSSIFDFLDGCFQPAFHAIIFPRPARLPMADWAQLT